MHNLSSTQPYLQITVPGSIHNGALQLEGVHKWNQGGQTGELNALIDLCDLEWWMQINEISTYLLLLLLLLWYRCDLGEHPRGMHKNQENYLLQEPQDCITL